jgi:excisionase family DNA binding protein
MNERAATPLLTSEVARLLNISSDMVRLLARLGRLPAVRTERGVRLFNRGDVVALAASCTPSCPGAF